MSGKRLNIYFSQIFNVDPKVIEDYGALDIALLTDLPLFVDPFLLFNSEKAEYQKLHHQIIDYLLFLKDMTARGNLNSGLLKEWFVFSEVKQNWLGYSEVGNEGRGLGMKFAVGLARSLDRVLSGFGSEKVTSGSHLEKLTLIHEGIGKDSISDFTTNLIKDHLIDYTEEFARQHLEAHQVRHVGVERARFNYKTRTWQGRHATLPWFSGDYVLLTPRDILVKDDTWINSSDLADRFSNVIASVSNEVLRGRLNQYFLQVLPISYTTTGKVKRPSQAEARKAVRQVIAQFPEVLDYYIRQREVQGDGAKAVSRADVKATESVFIDGPSILAQALRRWTQFYDLAPNTYEDAKARVLYLKDIIENKGGHGILYSNGEQIAREKELQLLFRYTWFGSFNSISREVNDGRGPVDFLVSKGAFDKTLVEFKLASNTRLKQNLQNQTHVYEAASDATYPSLKVIVYFTAAELERVERILKEVDMVNDPSVILIDARADNKPSGSRA